MKSHAKHMVIGGAVILVALMAFGVSWRQAAQWAVLLACPVMMMFMMAGGHGHGGHGGHAGHGDAAGGTTDASGRDQVGPDRERIDGPPTAAPHDHGSH
ncbi:MAG: hypothetical protein BGO38_09665 [Cellulomonas sp. 73-145]|uniref:DUF2933 domain-containing protein n=1 Tax=Cellulomonas sp. 73-145 TaxID=1895739 RepID=UPI0009295698|nr:DUF2933 domain-containing protein [Cellulomonas sp. 73-145]MBN9327219.1 DUF2933 domain-containing protein [Cellulomonas sp.]OJV60970.1 MAG: hypothetical protein BGO38_09665 [Cellulomonas sp. 73-145]